jgi:hypothetical protein
MKTFYQWLAEQETQAPAIPGGIPRTSAVPPPAPDPNNPKDQERAAKQAEYTKDAGEAADEKIRQGVNLARTALAGGQGKDLVGPATALLNMVAAKTQVQQQVPTTTQTQ